MTVKKDSKDSAPEQPALASGYYVKKGCAITSKRGVLESGAEPLKPEWFRGGQDTIDSLVKSGHVEKK